jgi:hypothetical protein
MKDRFIKLILWLIRQLHKIYRIAVNNTQNKSPLVSLAPQINEEESQDFLNCLADALENKTIRNIAVSGLYGSGKSTFLKTFEYYHKEYSYLNISLASFNCCSSKFEKDEKDNANEGIKKSVIRDNLLEKSILEQMIYHVKNKSLPDSRLKRITHLSRNNVLIRSVLIGAWLISVFVIIRFKLWIGIETFRISLSEIVPTGFWLLYSLLLLILLVFAIGLIFLISFVARLLNNAQFSKLNLKTVEIKLFDDKTPSVLNHHLDEILYFFEATNFDVVIFEDLDRFNNTDIFVKLREINILINKSEQINREVTFIYAIKDDMFANEERTKFFDFIIPIIPVITSTNSKQKLINRLNQLELIDNDLSEEFVSDISLYISDMRILNNIVNEFIIYKQRIKDNINQLKTDKLFSMVVYKNLYPTDFAQLHKKKGVIFETLNKRAALASKAIKEKQNDLDKLKMHLENINKETLNSIFELRSAYIQQLIKMFPDTHILSVTINNTSFSITQLVENNVFNQFRNKSVSGYDYYSGYSRGKNHKISFQDVEAELAPHATYDDREKTIIDKGNNKTNSLKVELSKLEREISIIKSYTLSELINQFGIEWDSNIESKDLLKFLIRNGLINEEYKDYISYFYPGTISANDKDFLLSIKNHDHLGNNHPLDNLVEVIKSIREHEFQQEEILNFELIEFLLTNSEKYQQQLSLILKQLSNEKNSSVKFIDEFIQTNQENLSLFIKMICNSWKGFWTYIEKESFYDYIKICNYLKLIVTHANLKDIKTLNQSCSLSNYISSKKDFLHIIDDVERLKEVIDCIPIKFENLKITNKDKDKILFEHVYKHDYYMINFEMVELIIRHFNTDNSLDIEKLKTANYTTIMQSDCENLKSYLEDNITDYLHDVFFIIESNTEESEKSIISLLNNENIDIDDKLSIIEGELNLISTLDDIADVDLWESIITNGKCKVNWKNIIVYYATVEEIDDCLKRVFNNKEYCNLLSKEKLKTGDETITLLCKQLALLYDISDECYERLAGCIPFWYSHLDFNNFTKSKIEIMLNKRLLRLSVDNFNALKDNYAKCHITLLTHFFNEYLDSEKFSQYACDADDFSDLLASKTITITQKDRLIQTFSLDTYEGQWKLSNLVGEIIIKTRKNIDYNLVMTLVKNGSSREMKIKLLVNQFDNFNQAQITNILINIGGEYAKIASKGPRPIIPYNEDNNNLLEKLISRGYISPKSRKVSKGIKVITKMK